MNFSNHMTERRQRDFLIARIAAWLIGNGYHYALITRSPKAFGHIWAIVNGREFFIEVRIGAANLRRKRGSGNCKPSLPQGKNSLFTPSPSLWSKSPHCIC